MKVPVTFKLWEGVNVIGKTGVVTTKLVLSTEIELTVAFTVPVLVTVNVLAADAVPTVWLPKLMEEGATVIFGGEVTPDPESPSLLGEYLELL